MAKTLFKISTAELTVRLERIFYAEPEVVFNAYVDPEILVKWWGDVSMDTRVEKLDPRVGGEWRFISRPKEGGKEVGFHGVYTKFKPGKILEYTFTYEDIPGGLEMLERVRFNKVKEGTKIVSVSQYEKLEDMGDMLGAGDEQAGELECWDRLAHFIEGHEGHEMTCSCSDSPLKKR